MTTETFEWLGAPQVYPFYGGTVALHYDDDEHAYYRYDEDGKHISIPGATSVCGVVDRSGPLMQWSATQAAAYFRQQVEAEMACGKYPITDNTLASWYETARALHRTIKEDAGAVGKIAHAWIEQLIKSLISRHYAYTMKLSRELPENDQARAGCTAALDWMVRHKVRWVFTERKIYSRAYDYAGTCDGLAYITACGDPECCGDLRYLDGRWHRMAATFTDVLAVIDWKTSRSFHDAFDWQTAAYLNALIEEAVVPPDTGHRFLVRLDKEDAHFESRLLLPESLARDWVTFHACLDLYRLLESRKEQERLQRFELKEQNKADKLAALEAEKALRKAAKEQLKAEKAQMFEEMRRQGLSIAKAKASVREHYRQTEEQNNGRDDTRC